ncbi:MAG: YHYH protein [Gammaproteobacteria bacterium]|nr:YHYH protein [Gammaproteobacteria bacterium]
MKPRGTHLVALALACAMASCGGGGGSASSSVPPASSAGTGNTTTAPAPPATPVTPSPGTPTNPTAGSIRYKVEAWADNWFAAYVGSTKVAEDSVPITTERSFNSETFTFDATPPFDLNLILKDYKQDDSGLEYIGTPQQQIGDGGFIAQVTDTGTGNVVAVSSSSWKCKVINKAPLNKACARDTDPIATCGFSITPEPTGWMASGYDTSGWENATEYTAAAVGVKDGYYDITWSPAAKLIWTSDLQADNTLLCKVTVPGTPATPGSSSSFTLTSSAVPSGGALSAEYTCDGRGSTLPLAWSGAPAGTREFALLMTTLPGDGTTRWNWVVYGIPSGTSSLPRDAFGVGTVGVGSDSPTAEYDPPCSQGPGAKTYTYTLYALSGAPTLPASPSQVTGKVLADAIAPLTIGSASLGVNYTRTNPTGSSAACVTIRVSLAGSKSGGASVNCDATFAYVNSYGIASHAMMDGIRGTNLQVPILQNFRGANAWKIPLAPSIAAAPTSVVDGPVGVAVNGVPIFNPCKQGGCQNGDTKVLGELDICNGHAGRADDYHYHAAPVCLMAEQSAGYWDTHPVGWALDGFAIFGYRNADGTTATRDSICGGNTSAVVNAPSGYSYHLTDLSPYVLSCLVGTPSPDLANQGSKFSPIRQPPVTPFNVSGMTLTTDAADGYRVLQFTSATSFVTTESGSDSYSNPPGTYRIRYKPVTGAALASLLAQPRNAGKTACWNFQFVGSSGAATQPEIAYCR